MYERRLLALGYHNSTNFNPNDSTEFQNLVIWLEENHIRSYPVDQRSGLRQTDSNQWQKYYEKYLNDLKCPFRDNKIQSLCWLLGYALRLNNDHGTERETDHKSGFLTEINADSQEFLDGVNKLSELLKIPPHPDPQVRLEACCKLLQSRVKKGPQNEKGVEIRLQDHDFGFTDPKMDPVLKEAGKILRLHHLTSLRKLQSEINNTIELVQSATANPKTDAKLGKVGR